MNTYDLIMKKRNGEILDKDEITYLVEGFTNGTIPDYQMSAFLMAVYFEGMNDEETTNLTMAMADSGDRLDLSGIHGKKVDKHSTGGVGDKTSLIVGPILASLGVPVAKMSGRGLGHTGGTIDKLEGIPGFQTSISEEAFMKQVNEVGLAIVGQTANLAPADKKIYALRDVTATVDNISLIAASIMSKKLAAGADGIVLDVKTGTGAFMKTLSDSEELAKAMCRIGQMAGRDMVAVITDMNEPLGNCVGNILEVLEAVECLKGNGECRLMEVCRELAAAMLVVSGKVDSLNEAYPLVAEAIESGRAFEKMKEFVAAQGGDVTYLDHPERFPKTVYEKVITGGDLYRAKTETSDDALIYTRNEIRDDGLISTGEETNDDGFIFTKNKTRDSEMSSAMKETTEFTKGYLAACDNQEIGMASLLLGGGRRTKDEVIDLSVGIRLYKHLGDSIERDETVAVLYANDEKKLIEAEKRFVNAYELSEEPVEKNPVIYGIFAYPVTHDNMMFMKDDVQIVEFE